MRKKILYYLIILVLILNSCVFSKAKTFQLEIKNEKKYSSKITDKYEKVFYKKLNKILDNKSYNRVNTLIGRKVADDFEKIKGKYRTDRALFNNNDRKIVGGVTSFSRQNEFIIILSQLVDNGYIKVLDIEIKPKQNENEILFTTNGISNGKSIEDMLIITDYNSYMEQFNTLDKYHYVFKFIIDGNKGEIVDITKENLTIYIEDGL